VRLTIDTDTRTLRIVQDGSVREVELYSREAFEAISRQWLRVGWDQKHIYTFSWLGRPIIQLPEDMFRVQEVVHRLRPDVIIETGVAHGGSLIFYATLCKAMDHGEVIGVEVDLRPHNRAGLEQHPLWDLITIVDGSSTDPDVVDEVRDKIGPDDVVLVLLDSNHSKAHVLAELEAYHRLVTPGSYIVATDGIMAEVHDVPRGHDDWVCDNPWEAAKEFLATNDLFRLEQPEWPFSESPLTANISHWPGAWLRRL
jgi:cephalosporin hydroxylase